MVLRRRARVVCTALTLLLAGAGMAGAADVKEARLALVIANGRYQHADALPNALRDGRAMAVALGDRGFTVLPGYDLDRHGMNRLIDDFIARLTSRTIAILYYAGHGVQIGGNNYLIPIDLKPDHERDVANDGIELGEAVTRMALVNERFNLAIIDACRDNPFAFAVRSLSRLRGLAPTTATGSMIVYAAGANQAALDRLGPEDRDPNGLFTRELLKIMRVPGLQIREAIARVKVAVAQQAAAIGRRQTPAVYDEAVGDFIFTPLPQAPPPTEPPVAVAVPTPQLPVDATEALHRGIAAQRSEQYVEAMGWYRQAADQGNLTALNNIGWLYENALGVPEDFAAAMRWFRQAADKGNNVAMYNVGFLFSNGWGVQQDHAEAMRWYRQAADKGNDVAMNRIGFMYGNGWGVARDYAEALHWHRLAAEKGNSDAMNNIGLLYSNGWGVPQDFEAARRWYIQAADKGNDHAMSNIGMLYAKGRAGPKDCAAARWWFARAAAQGNEAARRWLDANPDCRG